MCHLLSDFMGAIDIQIERWGRILTGENAGLFIFIKDDSTDTGGFLIFQAKEPSIENAWDNWAGNLDEVKRFFKFAGWRVEWL